MTWLKQAGIFIHWYVHSLGQWLVAVRRVDLATCAWWNAPISIKSHQLLTRQLTQLTHSYQAFHFDTGKILQERTSWHCQQDIKLKIGKATSSKRASLLTQPKAILQYLQGKSWWKSLQKMDWAMIKQLGITVIGEALFIFKQAKEPSTQIIYAKAPSAKLPQLHFEITPLQFRKFWIYCEVFTGMTDMPTSQTSIQLYSCADESVQNAIINTYTKFFTIDPDKLLEMIVGLVTQKSNPMVHRWKWETTLGCHSSWHCKYHLEQKKNKQS